MAQSKAFIERVQYEIKRDTIADSLKPKEQQAILLLKAYQKRIKPVPQTVNSAAVMALNFAARRAHTAFLGASEAVMVLDMVGDKLWGKLDEAAAHAWLLKVE